MVRMDSVIQSGNTSPGVDEGRHTCLLLTDQGPELPDPRESYHLPHSVTGKALDPSLEPIKPPPTHTAASQ